MHLLEQYLNASSLMMLRIQWEMGRVSKRAFTITFIFIRSILGHVFVPTFAAVCKRFLWKVACGVIFRAPLLGGKIYTVYKTARELKPNLIAMNQLKNNTRGKTNTRLKRGKIRQRVCNFSLKANPLVDRTITFTSSNYSSTHARNPCFSSGY